MKDRVLYNHDLKIMIYVKVDKLGFIEKSNRITLIAQKESKIPIREYIMNYKNKFKKITIHENELISYLKNDCNIELTKIDYTNKSKSRYGKILSLTNNLMWYNKISCYSEVIKIGVKPNRYISKISR